MKFKKIIVFAVLSILILSSGIFASGFNPGVVPNETINQNIKTPIDRVYGSILLILQVASVAGVIIAGVRFMFASSDKKAEIKSSLILLVIGLTIVFAATTVISFITKSFNQIVQ